METKRSPAGPDPDSQSTATLAESTRPARAAARISPLVGWSIAGAVGAICLALLIIKLTQPPDEIEKYQVARPPVERMLVATFPRKDATWFFKLQGPAPDVARCRNEFEQFLHSIRFRDLADPPVSWTLPRGWRQEPGKGLRFATLRLGPDGLLAVLVTRFGPESAGIVKNLNRWRNQLGLPPLRDAKELRESIKQIDVQGQFCVLVDLTGKDKDQEEEIPDGAPSYTPPKTWTPAAHPNPIIHDAYEIREGNETATVSVTVLAGPARGVLPNVQRWRGQLGLGPATDEELAKAVKECKVDGSPAPFVDLTGPGREGKSQRVLAVGVSEGDRTWYFTLKGPADLVAKHRAEFLSFIQSIRLGGKGASHE